MKIKLLKAKIFALSFLFVLTPLYVNASNIVLIPFDGVMIPIVLVDVIDTIPLVSGEIVINKDELLTLVNAARVSGQNCGGIYYEPVDPLTWNATIESAARIHSDDMYRNNFLSHTGSDNSSPGDRLERVVGYQWSAYGENIAAGYTSESSVISAWLNSPGHCSNIMRYFLTEMGVSRVGNYWTQDFGDTF